MVQRHERIFRLTTFLRADFCSPAQRFAGHARLQSPGQRVDIGAICRLFDAGELCVLLADAVLPCPCTVSDFGLFVAVLPCAEFSLAAACQH